MPASSLSFRVKQTSLDADNLHQGFASVSADVIDVTATDASMTCDNLNNATQPQRSEFSVHGSDGLGAFETFARIQVETGTSGFFNLEFNPTSLPVLQTMRLTVPDQDVAATAGAIVAYLILEAGSPLSLPQTKYKIPLYAV